MADNHVRISPSSYRDLRDILAFTESTWGEKQALDYAPALALALRAIGENPQIGVERPQAFPGCRTLSVERHIVFYRVIDTVVEVIRILHQRQQLTGQFDAEDMELF